MPLSKTVVNVEGQASWDSDEDLTEAEARALLDGAELHVDLDGHRFVISIEVAGSMCP